MPKPDKSNAKAPAPKEKTSAASAKAKAEVSAVANPRLVAAIKQLSASMIQTQSYLVDVATICQEEQLTKAEVILSLMEARGIKKETAESQYSRMRAILVDPDALEELRDGEADLKTIRDRTKKPQQNPSAKRQEENREKRYSKAISGIVAYAKESGTDRTTILNGVKSALKKAGVK